MSDMEKQFRKRVAWSRNKPTMQNSLDSLLQWAEYEIDRLRSLVNGDAVECPPTPTLELRHFFPAVRNCENNDQLAALIDFIDHMFSSLKPGTADHAADQWVELCHIVAARKYKTLAARGGE